jgi:hypothetical protein
LIGCGDEIIRLKGRGDCPGGKRDDWKICWSLLEYAEYTGTILTKRK